MADTNKVQVKSEPRASKPAAPVKFWEPIENLRREIDRVFDSLGDGFRFRRQGPPALDIEFSWPPTMNWDVSPAVDVIEKEKAYQITAELPGLNETDIDVSVSNGMLTIKGEKKEEKETKEKDYYLSERRYGSFQRSFRIPEGVDADKIDASFKKGVLSVTLPKTTEAQKSKTIAVKAS